MTDHTYGRNTTLGNVTGSMITDRRVVVQQDGTTWKTIVSTCYLLGNRRMLQLMPLIVWSGFSFAYWFGFIETLVIHRLPDQSYTE